MSFALPRSVLLSAAFAVAWLSSPANAVVAPETSSGIVEIPRPSRLWIPDGYSTTPEARLAETLRTRGLLPRAVAGESGPSSTERGDPIAARRRQGAREAWSELSVQGAVRASARWDSRTGLPHRALLAGLRVPERGLSRLEDAERAARAFLGRQARLLTGGETPGADDLPLVKARRVGETWLLVFGQRWHGREVVDGRVDLRLRTDGDIPVLGSSWFAGV